VIGLPITYKVDLGIEVLNDYNVDWRGKVDVNNINMLSNCILDQVYGNFLEGIKQLSISHHQAMDCGFLYNGTEEKHALEREWTKKLKGLT
jgi:hypothetical protein